MTAPTSAAGQVAWRRLISRPDSALLAFDFDGTVAPIVPDPSQAYIHPDAVAVLSRLGAHLGAIAIVTGRPVRTVLRLSGLDEAPGLGRFLVLGQYGVERWQSDTGRIVEPPPPAGIAVAREELPGLLDRLRLGAAHIEDKGRALGVHVRRLPDPTDAFERLRPPLQQLADANDLLLEPGRMVLELRGAGVDKGAAMRGLVEEVGAEVVVFAGDDLGDLPAYDAVDAMRAEPQGPAGLLICSASAEQPALAARADLVVDGPAGLVAWLAELADRLED